MDVEVTPEATPQECEALRLALAALNGHEPASSAWWQAGAREAAGEEPDEG